MHVDFQGSFGTDIDVVNAARVSLAKESDWVYEIPEDILSKMWWRAKSRLSVADEKLIKYLVKHNHFTPFTHCFAKFRVRAPIFVARQLWKSHIGASGGDYGYPGWNETSRRYVDEEPTFFTPDAWRGRSDSVKQGSAGPLAERDQKILTHNHNDFLRDAEEQYEYLLAMGVCPEQARMDLPQAMETEWIWSGSLAFWSRMCKLRLDPHAQKESQDIAAMIEPYCREAWPVSWDYLMADPVDLMTVAELQELRKKIEAKLAEAA